jgi:dipeptidyl aminopeptidase/acylaminoacyl peptidase
MMLAPRSLAVLVRGLVACAVLALPLRGQNQQDSVPVAPWLAANRAILAAETYQVPPADIAKLVMAPRHLNVTLSQPSPDRRFFLKEQSEGLPSVKAFGKPHLYFAGLQVDPRANRARVLTTRGSIGLQLIDVTGKAQTIETPRGATVSSSTWSPDGKQLAYVANFDNASHVFVADIATGKSVQLTKTPLLATLVTGVDWTADGKGLITVLLPDIRGPEPKRPDVAAGPLVRLWTDGVKSPQRNFWSLLEEPFDKELMKYYVTGQLALIDVRTRTARKIGQPAMIQSVDGSPDGQFFRVATMHEPFSYIVQYSAFGTTDELWDATGKKLAEVSKRALREGPADTTGGGDFGGRGGAANEAKRGLAWMPQGPGLYYIEALPSAGDSTNPPGRAGAGGPGRGGRGPGGAPRRERLIQWLPPFGATDTKVLYQADGPISSVMFSDDAKTIFVATSANNQGELYAVNLGEPAQKMTILRQRNFTPAFAGGGGRFGGGGGGGRGGADDEAFYANPGSMMTKRGSLGGQVALVSADGGVYLTGVRYSRNYLQEAPRPFVDKYDIKTGQKTRLFEGPGDASTSIAAVLDDDFNRAIVTRESPREVGNSYLWTRATGQYVKLTNNTDHAPEFTSAIRKRVTVTRADGINFVVNVTLPANYTTGTRLPGMFWLYPYEYTSQTEYDRTLRTENINQFPNQGPRSIEYLVTQGYAVANFSPPVIGETGRMNDNYVSDLIMNLSAVIDELDKQGFIDRSRLGIGGHSYGAFTTMNALAHTPFFKAGIAGDGMYNRTLTPTAFQSERRDFWDAQKTYVEMSPFFYADKINGAVLMYHSMEDQNVGTNLISSVRMMQALRAQGKKAALFMYPYEDHGPATRESDLDQWARWVAWLDIYVKRANEAKGTKVVQ